MCFFPRLRSDVDHPTSQPIGVQQTNVEQEKGLNYRFKAPDCSEVVVVKRVLFVCDLLCVKIVTKIDSKFFSFSQCCEN